MEEADHQYEYWDSVAWDKVFTHPVNVELLWAHVPLEDGVFRLADGAIMRHHAPEWLESLLSKFEIVNLSHLDVATMNGNQAKVFQCVGRKQS